MGGGDVSTGFHKNFYPPLPLCICPCERMPPTDLLRSEIIANGILEPSANALFGDGGKVTLAQNRVDDPRKVVTGFWRDCPGKRNHVSRRPRCVIVVPARDTKEQTKLTRHLSKGMYDPSLLVPENRTEATATTAPMFPQGLPPTTKISVRRKEGRHRTNQTVGK